MKKKNRSRVIIFLILIVFIFACDITNNASEDDTSNQKDLEMELTRVVMHQTQTAMAAPATTEKEQPDDDKSDSEQDKEDGSEDETSCNASRMVSETVPDGTRFQAGETFTKSWTIRNAGDCDWTTDYEFVYESGDQMGGDASMNMPSVIEPGETVTLSIDFTAPTADGSYTGVWRLKADDGEKLGKYWASISVGDSSAVAGDSQPSDKEDDNGPPPPTGGGEWGMSEPQCGDGAVEGNEECDPPGSWCGRDLFNNEAHDLYCASNCTCTIWD
jgi:hypothetical protein